ncbi:PD-(D/E)XK nuclease family protein [Actinomyces sp. F1_1611]
MTEPMKLLRTGESFLVQGGPGTGKTQFLHRAIDWIMTQDRDGWDWAPFLVLTPDRRRAAQFEREVPSELLGAITAPGGHRVVRGTNSYAYLVLSEWALEREEPLPRPKLTGGAEEDLWFARWLGEHGADWPDLLPADALNSEAVRMELRNLVARLGESGLDGPALADLAREAGVPAWQLAAAAYSDYAGVEGCAFDQRTPRIDSARIQLVAASLLEHWEERAPQEGVTACPPVPRWVLVDDLQDCTPATAKLLTAMQGAGAQIVATCSPATATGSFRGARYDLGPRLARERGWPVLTLTRQWRLNPDLDQVVSAIDRWTAPGAQPEPLADSAGAAQAVILTGPGRRGSWLAQQIRRHHYLDGIGWDRQAVLVRQAGDIDQLQRQLLRAGVRLAPGQRALQFSKIPVTAMLLQLLLPTEDPAQLAQELLFSALVQVDRLELYQLLRQDQRGDQSLADTLLSWLQEPDLIPAGAALPRELRDRLERAGAVWLAREEAATDGAQGGLWRLWEAAGVAQQWQQEALRDGVEAERADSRLDAVTGLFRRADLWEQQRAALGQGTQSSARAFAEELWAQTVSADSIATGGLREPGVEVLTVAQAAGREWDVVYVVGLQEGAWPPRPRLSGLFHLARLQQLLAELPVSATAGQAQEFLGRLDPDLLRLQLDQRQYRLERRKDEARLLASACSRARDRLYLVAVESQEDAVSSFLNYLAKQGAVPDFRTEDGQVIPTEVPPPFDLDALVGRLRFATVDPQLSSADQTQAAALLAVLAEAGIDGADPRTWVGAGGISAAGEPIVDGKLGLSPSQVETGENCLLRWFMQSAYGEDRAGIFTPTPLGAADKGNLIHAVAEAYPHGSRAELQAEFARQWDALELDESKWWVQRTREQMVDWVDVLASYVAGVPGTVEVERQVRTELDHATVYGRVDRLEFLDDGAVRIVDIKTMKTAPSAQAVESNWQLVSYQLALREELAIAEAGLLTVAAPAKSGLLRAQLPLTDEEAGAKREHLDQLAQRMHGPTFRPDEINGNCRTCQFLAVCPLKDEGVRSVP